MGASESKLAFKEDIFRLAGDPDIAADNPWWARFYQLPETADDVFALWSPNDLRNLTSPSESERSSRAAQVDPQRNIETLIYTVIARLDALQSKPVYSDAYSATAPETLNCVRILTRLLPYIYEADHLAAWEEKFFWQPRKPTWTWDRKYRRRGPLFDGLNPAKKLGDVDENAEIGRPLGEQLIDLLINYLFLPSFALPKKLDANGNVDMHISYSIWQSGIGCKQSHGMTKENEKNAMEVLRLLLTLTSKTMYLPPGVVAEVNVRALTYLTTQSSRQVVLSLVCSLLNTVLKYNPATWRMPLDLSAVTKDPKQSLVTYSLQFLLVLVIQPVPNDEPNEFRKALSRLHRAEDFQFIQQGLTLVLTQPVSGVASYVPSASKALPWASEMLILFWELLQCNKRFRSFIVDTDRAHDFVVLVLYYAMDAKDDPARQGTVRMCVLILQTLSVEPSFGKRLNKPFKGHDSLPAVLRIPNFHGSYADYLNTSIYTILTTTKGRLETIYPALLAIVNNIAPYVRDLERATSSRMLDLFTVFSSPKFLLANESNHLLLRALIEAMNAILEHQYQANRRFVEVIVRSHKRFEALRDFTVDGALTELDRMAQERKERGAEVHSVARETRQNSADSVRSPVSTRSPSLGNVPEHGAFAIGDDEHEDDDDSSVSSPTPMAQSSSGVSGGVSGGVEDAVPVQSRSMSEKARGKQPMGQGSFSRSTSRNASTTSLASIINQSSSNANFTPSAEWLETWLPHLPLHDILLVIDTERDHLQQQRRATWQQQQWPSTDSASTGTAKTVLDSSAHTTSRATTRDGSPASPSLPENPSAIKVQSFSWSPLALGWYLSMLWGFIYAQDASANRGSNGLWTGTAIRLFNIQSRHEGISLRRPKGAVDAVGDSLARRITGLGFSAGTSSPTSSTSREV